MIHITIHPEKRPRPFARHEQACACAFLNIRMDPDPQGNPPTAHIPFEYARTITRFSLLAEDAAIGRLIRRERP